MAVVAVVEDDPRGYLVLEGQGRSPVRLSRNLKHKQKYVVDHINEL